MDDAVELKCLLLLREIRKRRLNEHPRYAPIARALECVLQCGFAFASP